MTRKTLGHVYDTLWELKTAAGQLEDENRELKEKLRFKSDQYEFRLPFWYEKGKDQQPLCPKCFAKDRPVAAPMSQTRQSTGEERTADVWCATASLMNSCLITSPRLIVKEGIFGVAPAPFPFSE
ncbi:MAG TPA: hypothetical protein VI488_02625 [Candidatus Angelobacter sp.]